MMPRTAVVAMLTAVLTALLSASGVDVPPRALVQENVQKASVIVKGRIDKWEVSKPGTTVAHFHVTRVYRGAVKAGDDITFASFKEDDRYPDRLLHTELLVFLRARQARYTPPKLETATDLSEFVFVPELEALLPASLRKSPR